MSRRHLRPSVAAALGVACVLAVAASPALAAGTLAGRTIVLDPGHNGGNAAASSVINRHVAIGQGRTKACDTTGTQTDRGYAEAAYTWDVALRARRVLRRRGANVVLTRADNHSVGPCIDERLPIANRIAADAAVSIHADGGPASGFGFHVIEPARITGLTDDVFAASHRLAVDLRSAFRRATGEPYSTYLGHNGIDRRSDLGGLRLADVPAVFIETGNMRNANDAARLVRASYRLRVARGIANGIQRFLSRSVAAAAAPPAARTETTRVQLDGDAALEQVDVEHVRCAAGLFVPDTPAGCGVIRVIDGSRSQRLTPPDQRPRLKYGWSPRAPRFVDLTGDGRAEIVWELGTTGATASSPVALGVHRWDGRRARRIFHRSSVDARSQSPTLRILPERRGLRELLLVESVPTSTDPTCCPTFRRTRRYRWDGNVLAAVPGSTRVTRY